MLSLFKAHTSLRQSTDPGMRRSTFVHHVADTVPPVSSMEREYREGSRAVRGIMWALAVSCPFWAIALGATLVAVFA